MKRNRNYFRRLLYSLIIISLVSQVSCLDRLDFIAETEEGQLVITGLLTDGEGPHQVTISRTSPFGLPPAGATGATVKVLSAKGEWISYTETGRGNYELNGFTATEGEEYALEVWLDGVQYASYFQKMPNEVGIDEVSLKFNFEPYTNNRPETVLTISAETTLPPAAEPIYLRWQLDEAYMWLLTSFPCSGLCPPPPNPCYIFDSIEPNRITLFNGSSTVTRRTFQTLGKRKVDNSFLYPFFVTVKQLSISKEAFQFWERVKTISDNTGSPFDTPPAPILGNIVNLSDPADIVLGYFEVAKETVTRIYTTRNEVPYYLNPICTYLQGTPITQYGSECKSCEARARGRKWRDDGPPSWWKY
jgi:hypothetical protein